MRRALNLLLTSTLLLGCSRGSVDPPVSACTFGGKELTRTGEFIREVPATVIAVKSTTSPVISFQILREGADVPLGSCGLPTEFAKDSLQIMVSGYLLTFPGLELMNLSPLPFEVTKVRLRQ